MSMLGEVVFCVDCDRARLSHLQSVPAAAADPQTEPPRRMAIKMDANRDPLCASCLDSRQARRRAEFMLHEARAPIGGIAPALYGGAMSVPASQPAPLATAASAPRKRVEFVRIARLRPQETDVAPKPRKKRAAQKLATPRNTPPRRPSANGRALERRFLLLVLEIGFLRAQELLDELERSVRARRYPSRRGRS